MLNALLAHTRGAADRFLDEYYHSDDFAVPHMAASIAGGTIGLALSHAFEAAYVAQTIIRPITSALQTGFNRVAQIGNGSTANGSEATGWVKAMDFGRQT
jgi:hypothetical protein